MSTRTVSFIDQRLKDIFRYPLAWGSLQSIELQVLLLVECKASLLLDEPDAKELLWVHQLLLANKSLQYPQAQSLPLHEVVGGVEELIRFLRAFTAEADTVIKFRLARTGARYPVEAPEDLRLEDVRAPYPRTQQGAH